MDLLTRAAVIANSNQHICWHFDCLLTDLPADTFVVTAFTGQQSLSESDMRLPPDQSMRPCIGFCYQIELASDQLDLDLDALVDRPAELIIRKNEQPLQHINGIIRQISAGHYGQGKRHYRLLLVPALERLSLRHNMRIFQSKSAREIIEILFSEMGLTEYRFDLQRPARQREFCVQYRQSDLDFLCYLANEEGWVFYFDHQPGSHQLVFSDLPSTLPQRSEPILYHGQGGGVSQQLHIHQLEKHHQQLTSSTTRKDFTFKNPAQPLLSTGADLSYQGNLYEHYDWGRHKDSATAQAHSQQQLDALRRDAITATGQSNHPLIQAGYRITIEDEFKSWIPGLVDSSQQQWTVVQVCHQGKQPQSLHDGTGEGTDYHNSFTLIPADRKWQSAPKARPQADSLVNGIVVGPAGEEIYCDPYGRVKVHFLWDRDSQQNEHSSPWIRVAQNWAGGKHGAISIPRIGDEVLISFLYNDPDQPIITGRAFNDSNRPPRNLPEHKTQSVLFRTHSHQGNGFNELRTEDQAGKEQIYLHGQKDFVSQVLNDQLAEIGRDHQAKIGQDQQVEIGHDDSLTVNNDQKLTVNHQRQYKVGQDEQIDIGKDQQLTVAGQQVITVNQSRQLQVKQNQHTKIMQQHQITVGEDELYEILNSAHKKVAAQYRIDVGEQFELVCGQSKLILNANGEITLQGNILKILGGKEVTIDGKRLHLS